MWVAELGCEAGHGFEGYFGSKDEFDSQRERGLVSCPVCGSARVERRLSVPRINVGAKAPQLAPQPAPQTAPNRELHELVARLRAGSEDVGTRFADEARRMHEGEVAPRAIRGQTRGDELIALLEDGVPVLPLPDLDPLH